MLTVLNVAYPFAPVGPGAVGGAEQVLSALDAFLHARGERSLVLACEGSRVEGALCATPLPTGPLLEAVRAAGHARYRSRLDGLLREQRVDLVHMHGVDFHAYLPEAHVPVLVTLHLPLSFYGEHALTRALARSRLALYCVSETQRQSAPPTLRGRLGLLPNGVPLAAFAPPAREGEHEGRAGREPAGALGAPVGGYLLVLSRICPEKGVHLALDLARQLDLEAIVAGRVYPYPEHQRYFEREIAPRLDARRRFVGPVGLLDKAELLRRARCLIVPSLVDETSSLVSMEALAAGTPVVALRRGALPEVIEHGVTGFLADTPEQLAAAVRAVPELSRARCRAVAEMRFSAAAMCERYLAAYRELAGPEPSTAYAAEGSRSIADVSARAAPARAAGRGPMGISIDVSGDSLALRELDSPAALEALRDAWCTLWERCPEATIFQRPEWLIAYVRHLLRGELRALSFWRERELVGLAPFFVWRDGPRRVLSLLGAGVSDYQDVLFEPAHREGALRGLERWLAGAAIEACAWSELVPSSPLLSPLCDCAGSWESRLEPQEPCPALSLPQGAELLPQLSKNMRRTLQVARHRAAADGFAFEAATAERLPALLADLLALHMARRAQLGSSFADPRTAACHAAAAPALLASGHLRMYALTRAGARGAVLYALRERDTLRLYQHGFDPALARYSPGALLCAHAIDRAHEEGATSFDFLRGTESYKYRWGARDRLRLVRRRLARAEARRACLR